MRAGGQFKAELLVIGANGSMRVSNPLVPQIGHSLDLQLGDKKTSETFALRSSYDYQLDAFTAAVISNEPVLTDGRDAVSQMTLIDRVYQAAGLSIRGVLD